MYLIDANLQSNLMAEADASEVAPPGAKNGNLDLKKIASQFAQFMDVDTAKDVSFYLKLCRIFNKSYLELAWSCVYTDL